MLNTVHNEKEVLLMSPLIWAYIGDSVFEIYIRDKMINRGLSNNTKLHKESVKYVKAKSQSDILQLIGDMLTEDEKIIVKRARNTTSNTVPKNADIIEYRNATAFEGLLGFLYLVGNNERLMEILDYSYNNFNI